MTDNVLGYARSDRDGRNGFNYTRQKIQPRNRLV